LSNLKANTFQKVLSKIKSHLFVFRIVDEICEEVFAEKQQSRRKISTSKARIEAHPKATKRQISLFSNLLLP